MRFCMHKFIVKVVWYMCCPESLWLQKRLALAVLRFWFKNYKSDHSMSFVTGRCHANIHYVQIILGGVIILVFCVLWKCSCVSLMSCHSLNVFWSRRLTTRTITLTMDFSVFLMCFYWHWLNLVCGVGLVHRQRLGVAGIYPLPKL